jgi:hypothetical protein
LLKPTNIYIEALETIRTLRNFSLKQGKNNYILDYYSFNERGDYIETKLIARNPSEHIQLKKIEQGEVNI